MRWVVALLALVVAGCADPGATPDGADDSTADPTADSSATITAGAWPEHDEAGPDCPDPETPLPPNAWRQAAFNRTPEAQAAAWSEAIGDPIVERLEHDEGTGNLHWRTQQGSLSYYGGVAFGVPRLLYSTDRPWPAASPDEAIAEARRILSAFGVEAVEGLDFSTSPASADTFDVQAVQDGPIGSLGEVLCSGDGRIANTDASLQVRVGPKTPADAHDYIQGSYAELRPFSKVILDGPLAALDTVKSNASAVRVAYCAQHPRDNGPPAQTEALRPQSGVRSGRVAYLFDFHGPTSDPDAGRQYVWVDAVTGRALDSRMTDRCD